MSFERVGLASAHFAQYTQRIAVALVTKCSGNDYNCRLCKV